MVWNPFRNVSVSEKSEMSRKTLHGIIVGFSGKFQFPVLRSKPEVENTTVHGFRVNSIHPKNFIQIGPRMSEILQITPKMNAILILHELQSRVASSCNTPSSYRNQYKLQGRFVLLL